MNIKKHNPQETMPDEGTEVLAYFSNGTGFIVTHYVDGDWLDSWGGSFINVDPEFWVDLDDIRDSLK